MKKVLIFGIVILVLIGVTMSSSEDVMEFGYAEFVMNLFAGEEDPVWEGIENVTISYKNKNMTVKFDDKGTMIGQATLKSHKTYDEIRKVPTGKNRTVIWYEFSDFKDIQLDALKGVEFIDMREMIENKSYTSQFKEEEFEKIDNSKVLINNPNYLLPIEKNYSFVYLNKEEEWLDYNSFDIPKENMIIGVQTNLFWGEFIDVRFNIFENKLDKHAVVLGVSAGFVTEAPTGSPSGNNLLFDNGANVVGDMSPATARKITEIGWYTDEASPDADFQVGVYDDDSGLADILIHVSDNVAKGTDAGWHVITGLNWIIEPETMYWIGAQLDNTNPATGLDASVSGGYGYDRISSVTELPNPYNGGSLYDSDGVAAIYAVWEVVLDTTPTVSLNEPPNATAYSTEQNVLFNCTVQDDFNVTNVTFYWDVSGTFIANGTTFPTTNESTKYEFDREINTFGDFVWNCYACDNATTTNCAFNKTNKTFSYHSGNLNITDPTTDSPNITSVGEVLTVTYDFQKDGVNLTSNVETLGINISGTLCDLNVNEGCDGIPTACDQFTDEANCTFTNCTWSRSGPSANIEFETFESSLGNWDATGGDPGCDWLRDQDGTPSSATGPQPQGSAPGANSTFYYVFVEASSGQCDNLEQAYLLGPTIDFDVLSIPRLDFSYSMYGANMGTLNVQINTSGTWSTIWTLSGDQGSSPVWSGAGVDLSAYSGDLAIRFEYDRDGSAGFAGDIALDHINITGVSDACSGTPLDCNAVNYTQGIQCNNNTGCEFTNITEELYTAGIGWQVNCTVGAGCSGDNDLFLMANYTTEEIVRNDTQTNAVSCAAADTCSPSSPLSADHTFDCADDCTQSTELDAGGFNVYVSGTGTFTVTADIINRGLDSRIEGTDENNRCFVTCLDGGCFR